MYYKKYFFNIYDFKHGIFCNSYGLVIVKICKR